MPRVGGVVTYSCVCVRACMVIICIVCWYAKQSITSSASETSRKCEPNSYLYSECTFGEFALAYLSVLLFIRYTGSTLSLFHLF